LLEGCDVILVDVGLLRWEGEPDGRLLGSISKNDEGKVEMVKGIEECKAEVLLLASAQALRYKIT
jgi:hypothetical protein